MWSLLARNSALLTHSRHTTTRKSPPQTSLSSTSSKLNHNKHPPPSWYKYHTPANQLQWSDVLTLSSFMSGELAKTVIFTLVWGNSLGPRPTPFGRCSSWYSDSLPARWFGTGCCSPLNPKQGEEKRKLPYLAEPTWLDKGFLVFFYQRTTPLLVDCIRNARCLLPIRNDNKVNLG